MTERREGHEVEKMPLVCRREVEGSEWKKIVKIKQRKLI